MKKNTLNTFVGLISQIVILGFGFIVPGILISKYGSDTNGLMSTITQVFTYLALLEAGISQSSRNALYKCIGEKDDSQLLVVLSASRKYYRKISVLYLAFVVGLAVFLPLIIKTQIDFLSIALLILFQGLTNVISFYFLNTWTCYLHVIGKNYVTNSIELMFKSGAYFLEIVLALNKVNIAFIQLSFLGVSLLKLLLYSCYMKKNYPWIKCNAAIGTYRLPDRNSYLVNEVAWVVFSSTDMIVLSVFVSSAMASVYSIYSMIYSALNLLLNSAYVAICYNLGQTFHVNKNKYIRLHDCYNSMFMGGITALVSTAYLLTFPFIKLYTQGVSDVEYIVSGLPMLFSLMQMLSWSRYVSGNLTGIAGYAKSVSRIAIIEATINVVASVILVQFWGIRGVVIATVLALPVKVIYCTYLSDVKILERSCWPSIKIFLVNYIYFFGVVLLGKLLKLEITSYLSFIGFGLLISLVCGGTVFLANCFANRNLYKDLISLFFKEK